ncbi:MAG TPA: hypothetical protein PKD55_02820 [Bellilinea sp.]|nr:hypothetical protein [Bellilinea sp.]
MNSDQIPTAESLRLWQLKTITGPLLVVFLGLHLVVNHYYGSKNGLLSFEDVVHYFNNPLVPIVEFGFAVVVIVHSLLGLRSIILDLQLKPKTMRILDAAFTLTGAALVGYALWLTLKVVSF